MTDDAERETTPLDFEAALARLQEIVDALERGDLRLDEALAEFEEGVRLLRQCTKTLDEMELRVEQLLVTDDGEIRREPFDADDIDVTSEEE